MTHAHSPLDVCITEVWELLERIGQETTDSPGITRPAWSRNEERAADLIRAFARRHGLQVLNDAFGNIQFLLPGVDPATPCVTTGSHLDPTLIARIEDAAGALGIATRRMLTVGHDAAMFVRAGIPSAVILVRNAHGSHNSDEALDREDFAAAVHVLGRAMQGLEGTA